MRAKGEKGRAPSRGVLRAASCHWAPALEVVGHPASQRQGPGTQPQVPLPPGRPPELSAGGAVACLGGAQGWGEGMPGSRDNLFPVGLPGEPHPPTPLGAERRMGQRGGGGGAGVPGLCPWVHRPGSPPHPEAFCIVVEAEVGVRTRLVARSSFSHSSLAVTLSGPMVPPRTMLPLLVAGVGNAEQAQRWIPCVCLLSATCEPCEPGAGPLASSSIKRGEAVLTSQGSQ